MVVKNRGWLVVAILLSIGTLASIVNGSGAGVVFFNVAVTAAIWFFAVGPR